MKPIRTILSKIFSKKNNGNISDAEPVFMLIQENESEWQVITQKAQGSINEFRGLYDKLHENEPAAYFSIKAKLKDDSGYHGNIWLLIKQIDSDGFYAYPFELPKEFSSIAVGQVIFIPEVAILDWMVNDNGVLYGGYSLRYQRSKLSAEQLANYDSHIGVREYV